MMMEVFTVDDSMVSEIYLKNDVKITDSLQELHANLSQCGEILARASLMHATNLNDDVNVREAYIQLVWECSAGLEVIGVKTLSLKVKQNITRHQHDHFKWRKHRKINIHV